jgi:transcriptional repressor NrdR
MQCPYCQSKDTRVIDTTKDRRGGVRRRRECQHCKQRFSSYERPILATPLIIGEVEAALQSLGKAEVSSRIVGDKVIAGLKEMDLIAYIRYAIVYLGFDDLTSIRTEIDRLLEIN